MLLLKVIMMTLIKIAIVIGDPKTDAAKGDLKLLPGSNGYGCNCSEGGRWESGRPI